MTELERSLAEFLDSKRFDVRKSTMLPLEHHLRLFVKFLLKHGVTSPNDITREHLNLYRAELQRFQDSTQQQNVKSIKQFLRDIDSDHCDKLVRKLKTPKDSADGIERRKPRPLSDAEIGALLRVASPRVSLFFRTQLATGLAISDMCRLRAEHLKNGCVCIARQKTGKAVMVRIPEALFRELAHVLPIHPFWSESRGSRESGVTVWSREIRQCMCKADCYIPDNLTHRLRDTYVDRQLALGTPLAIIAAAIGDLQTTVESHYANLESMRMRQRIEQAPVIEIPMT